MTDLLPLISRCTRQDEVTGRPMSIPLLTMYTALKLRPLDAPF